jgi:ABC-2 type transport system permease protein
MSVALSLIKRIDLNWLTGPIFDKELRVSSRRRRNYWLRFCYVAILGFIMTVFWIEQISYRGSFAYQVSRMAELGIQVTCFLVWFQFIASQLIAIVMLSSSISGEIHHRTLGVLMTTPINALQIVLGKLLSKTWQLLLLIAISLPLLAIVRLFGGIPWGFLLRALTLTFTSILFVGSLSLLYSIYFRKAYSVIIVTVITLGVLYGLFPLLTVLAAEGKLISQNTVEPMLFYLNPFFALGLITENAVSPGRFGWVGLTSRWLAHCGVFLGSAVLLIGLAVVRVRAVALKQIAGTRSTPRKTSPHVTQSVSSSGPKRSFRPIKGCPVRWRECRTPLLGRHKWAVMIVVLLLLIPLAIIYGAIVKSKFANFDEEGIHMAFLTVYMGLGMLFTIVIPATAITSEKERRSWPVLLGTLAGDGNILWAKCIGALRGCALAWIPTLAHAVVFVLLGFIHALALIGLLLVIASTLVFHIGSGLYFSSVTKRTTSAVVLNFILPAVLWFFIPMVLAMSSELMRMGDELTEMYADFIPFVQMISLVDGGVPARFGQPLEFNGPHMHLYGGAVFLFLGVSTLLYGGIAGVFAWRAKARFRKNIF